MIELPAPVLSALAALSHAVGEDVELDAEGQCGLLFEGDVELVVSCAAEPGRVCGSVLLVPAPRSTALLREALELNHGAVAPPLAIAIDPRSEALVLWTCCDGDALDDDTVLERMAALVTLAPALRERLLATDRPGARDAADPAAPRERLPDWLDQGARA